MRGSGGMTKNGSSLPRASEMSTSASLEITPSDLGIGGIGGIRQQSLPSLTRSEVGSISGGHCPLLYIVGFR